MSRFLFPCRFRPHPSCLVIVVVAAAALALPGVGAAHHNGRPHRVSDLHVSTATSSSVRIDWKKQRRAVGYIVFRDGVRAGRTTRSAFTFRRLVCSRPHRLAVRSYDSAGRRSRARSLRAHTDACPPLNLDLPVVSGTAQQLQLLTGSTGTWTGAEPLGYAYQWLRCDDQGSGCAAISEADDSTYLPRWYDVDSTLRLQVQATDVNGSGMARSEATPLVAPRDDAPTPDPEPDPTPDPEPDPDPDPTSGTIILDDRSWTCRGAVDLDLVKVTIRTLVDDAIHLREDCHGRIGRVEIDTWTADGIKVNAPAPAAHDLVIGGGYVRCYQRYGSIHQDGIQVMGGTRLLFQGLEVNCTTAGNAQFFVSAANGGNPTDVVCENCMLGSGAATTLRIEESLRSGARNTLVCRGRYMYTAFEGGAIDAVNVGNTLLPTTDSRC